MSKRKSLSKDGEEEIIQMLKSRFEKHKTRFKQLEWLKIEEKLKANPEKLWVLSEMEETGGEPNLLGYDAKTNEFTFCDFSKESPTGRRSLCYDREALESRKKFKPKNNALDLTAEIGIEILDEAQYRELQQLGEFDTKTSSWLKTPNEIRELGGAIFGDFRYGKVFIYHNGAESYYAARGFRGFLKV
ncbi:Protein of unknown function [Salegentibacter agarivorans]|uniref:DUF4256 domain-containing protein n=1 Tax=Salegentibacter agarivorans TaxID=345907 RepID=A0A1I2PNS4_9FLAO|nr:MULTISPECIES: DUF4256 domain-containing protein [Salegentibacter]APS38933.1 hypothetical protein AO058_08630 [Salegentibacter sp. T436]SFG16779.1 Protein of unknown function [Salegentibacter agarivorans]